MLAFAPLAVDDPTEALDALTIGAEVYAHPSPALARAQSLAQSSGMGEADGTPLAVVVILVRDDEAWGACCSRCFRAVGDLHAAECTADGAVMPHEAVVRPAEQLRRSSAAA